MGPGLSSVLAKASLYRRRCKRCGRVLTRTASPQASAQPGASSEPGHGCGQCCHLGDAELQQLQEQHREANRSLGLLFVAAAAVAFALVLVLLV